jgi:hypothetical protein
MKRGLNQDFVPIYKIANYGEIANNGGERIALGLFYPAVFGSLRLNHHLLYPWPSPCWKWG